MKWVVVLAMLALAAAAGVGWMEARKLQKENGELRAELTTLKTQSDSAASVQAEQSASEIAKLRADAQDVLKLRNEVSQLRASTNEINKLRAQVSQLQAQARGQATGALPPQVPSPTGTTNDNFPRQSWNFAGYTTPEATLMSAIWAMREGKPQVYLDSLSPEEQQRMAQQWQNKSEQEIASKHQGDVANITNVRVMDRQPVSANEQRMTVLLEGPNRTETVNMKQDASGQWRFGGFIRNQQQQ